MMSLSIFNLNSLPNMKKSTLKLFIIAFFSGIIIPFNSESKAGVTPVPTCAENSLPASNTFCVIKPTVYKLDVYRAELCINDPMPTGTTVPKYDSSGCITLFDGSGTPTTEDIGNQSTAELPVSSADEIVPGTYRYLNLVFSSNIKASAKHTYGGLTYRTKETDSVENGETVNVTTNSGTPFVRDNYIETGENYHQNGWRSAYDGGDEEIDNQDCQNDGGTKTRCDYSFYYDGNDSVLYNVTAILGIVDSNGNFTEQNASNNNSIFYKNVLRSPLTLASNSNGFIDVAIKANITVQSNYPGEDKVIQLNAAPISFDMEFISQ